MTLSYWGASGVWLHEQGLAMFCNLHLLGLSNSSTSASRVVGTTQAHVTIPGYFYFLNYRDGGGLITCPTWSRTTRVKQSSNLGLPNEEKPESTSGFIGSGRTQIEVLLSSGEA
ncbi:hypothetical protein AAY473_008759 [Plecturocebus cupreus]